MTKRQQYINLFACSVFISLILFLTRAHLFWYAAPALILLAGLVINPFRQAILRLWLKFSHILGAVNSTIILFLIYFVIISPYAMVFRKKAASNYILRKPRNCSSLFRHREHQVTKKDFEKSW